MKPKSRSANSLVVFMLFAGSFPAFAQQPIEWQAAIDSALHNNLVIRNEKLKAEYYKKLTHAAASIPKTSLNGEFGQINSRYTDNRFGLSQSFEFPTVYIRQKNLYTEEWRSGQLTVQLRQAELRRQVSLVYCNYLYLKEKERLLKRYDSIYSAFLQKATLRLESGESSVVERILAENQKGTIAMQLKQVEQQIEVSLLEFNFVLNTPGQYLPAQTALQIPVELGSDFSALHQHPSLQLKNQQKRMAEQLSRLERARLLPDFNLGYSNMSMKGIGADEVYYSSERFQSVQAGLGIPLFFGAQRSKLSASKLGIQLAEMDYLQESLNIQNAYAACLSKYQSAVFKTDYYKSSGLKNAALIRESANKQLSAGEINYMEWVLLNNQSVLMESGYLDAVLELNETAIQLNYLLNR